MCHILVAREKYNQKLIFVNISDVKMKKSLVLNVQSLVLNVHLLYVQNQALKAYSNTCPCSDFITNVQTPDIVKYLPFDLKRIVNSRRERVLRGIGI